MRNTTERENSNLYTQNNIISSSGERSYLVTMELSASTLKSIGFVDQNYIIIEIIIIFFPLWSDFVSLVMLFVFFVGTEAKDLVSTK